MKDREHFSWPRGRNTWRRPSSRDHPGLARSQDQPLNVDPNGWLSNHRLANLRERAQSSMADYRNRRRTATMRACVSTIAVRPPGATSAAGSAPAEAENSHPRSMGWCQRPRPVQQRDVGPEFVAPERRRRRRRSRHCPCSHRQARIASSAVTATGVTVLNVPSERNNLTPLWSRSRRLRCRRSSRPTVSCRRVPEHYPQSRSVGWVRLALHRFAGAPQLRVTLLNPRTCAGGPTKRKYRRSRPCCFPALLRTQLEAGGDEIEISLLIGLGDAG